MNCAFVGRPARANKRVPSAILERAAFDLVCTCLGAACFLGFLADFTFFLLFMVGVPSLGLALTIGYSIIEVNNRKCYFCGYRDALARAPTIAFCATTGYR